MRRACGQDDGILDRVWLDQAADAGGRGHVGVPDPVVRAQIVPMRAAAAPEEAGETADVNDPDVLKGIDVDKLDWSQLNIDATTLNELIAAKKRAHAAASGEPNWSNDRRANGTSAVTVKQSVSLLWDTQVAPI
jgi:hypothetical protein